MGKSRLIPLSNGGSVLVDEDDHEWLSRWKWKRHVMGYACRTGWDAERKAWTCILMHRLLVNLGEGQEVDHINRDKLDNRRSNLRAITHSLNNHNQGRMSRNTSGQRGVVWDRSRNKWMVRFTLNGTTHHLGRFSQFEEAVAAYEEARSRLLPAY